MAAQAGGGSDGAAALDHAYRAAGATGYWKEVLRQVHRGKDPGAWLWVGHLRIFVQLANKERAFDLLERAYTERNMWLMNLKVDPRFDGLRSDRHYEGLLSRIALRWESRSCLPDQNGAGWYADNAHFLQVAARNSVFMDAQRIRRFCTDGRPLFHNFAGPSGPWRKDNLGIALPLAAVVFTFSVLQSFFQDAPEEDYFRIMGRFGLTLAILGDYRSVFDQFNQLSSDLAQGKL